VVAHDVWIRRALRADRVVRVLLAAFDLGRLGSPDEAVHTSPVDIGDRIGLSVRTPGVEIARVVEGLLATACRGIRRADRELAARSPRQAVRTGVGAEVLIEGAVLLHDQDHVLDLVDPRKVLRPRGARRPVAGRSERDAERDGCDHGDDSEGDDRLAHRLGRVVVASLLSVC
jgi:hypothetical protein